MKSLSLPVHTVPHWKALKYGKDDSKEKNCGSALNIHLDAYIRVKITYFLVKSHQTLQLFQKNAASNPLFGC